MSFLSLQTPSIPEKQSRSTQDMRLYLWNYKWAALLDDGIPTILRQCLYTADVDYSNSFNAWNVCNLFMCWIWSCLFVYFVFLAIDFNNGELFIYLFMRIYLTLHSHMKKQLGEYLFRWSVILFFTKLNVKGHVNEDHMCACTDCFKARIHVGVIFFG